MEVKLTAHHRKILLIVPLVGVLGGIAFSWFSAGVREEHTNCEVTAIDPRIKTAKGSSDPRVYTSCCTFSVGDYFFAGHFTAGDVYGKLVVGETVDLKTAGYRIPFLSMFPTVLEVS